MAKRGAETLQRLLEEVLANLDLRGRFREHLALLVWPEVAGGVVAAHAQAEAVRDGVLLVATDTPAWAQELQMRRKELLARIAAQVGEGVIREIHFRSGGSRGRSGREGGPRWWPGHRRRRTRGLGGGGRGKPAEVELSGRQQRRVKDAAAHIEDGELRERAERAFAALERMAVWRKHAGWRRCQRCGQWQRVGRRWCSSCSRAGRRRRRK